MKPVWFGVERPATLEEACEFLSDTGRDAKVLAGGQSLVPPLNFRLARPDGLVDLNPLEELQGLRVESGELRVRAMTRLVDLERSPAVQDGWQLVAEALPQVAHARR